MGTASSKGQLPATSLMVMILMILMKMMKVASSGGHLQLFGQSLNNNFGCVQIFTDIWKGEQENFRDQID